MKDRFDLQRFVEAQQPVYDSVRAELLAGRKRTHWMWFIFPQVAGLGHSDMARFFAITGIDEARAYLAHPLLSERLAECCKLVAAHDGRAVGDIFAAPDDLKFHSSMTLFEEAAPTGSVFELCLQRFFNGERDDATLKRLAGSHA
jgi:uncharacterized protein (DUF1810 family)